jgi:predicted metal-dependent hydrolase
MLSVRPSGAIRLSFPVWVTQKRALKFLDEKVDWIASARQKIACKNPLDTPAPPESLDPEARKAAEKRARQARETLRREAKSKLPAMVTRLAAEHGFRHGAVRIKATRSRWGSCTPRDDINLSMALAALPDHLAEYIILHELCHTVHRNHSGRFHALLDHLTGGRSKALNRELKQYRPEALIQMAGN